MSTTDETISGTAGGASPERAAGPPARAGEIETGMRTGQGADDEPTMTIGDRHAGEPVPDADGDGRLTVGEADAMLRGEAVDVNSSDAKPDVNAPPAPGTHQTT